MKTCVVIDLCPLEGEPTGRVGLIKANTVSEAKRKLEEIGFSHARIVSIQDFIDNSEEVREL